MRKETTVIESNMDVIGTYEGTEMLPFDKIFELAEGHPIDITLTSGSATIQITLLPYHRSKDKLKVTGQISAKFIEREPEM